MLIAKWRGRHFALRVGHEGAENHRLKPVPLQAVILVAQALACDFLFHANPRKNHRLKPVPRSESQRPAALLQSRDALDDLPILLLVECAMRLGAHVALRADRQRQLRHHVVVRRLDDEHRIVLSHHRVEGRHLGAVLAEGLLGRIDTVGRTSQMVESLMSQMEKTT